MGWDGWDGVGWDGEGWDGVGWDGVGWGGVEWGGGGGGWRGGVRVLAYFHRPMPNIGHVVHLKFG